MGPARAGPDPTELSPPGHEARGNRRRGSGTSTVLLGALLVVGLLAGAAMTLVGGGPAGRDAAFQPDGTRLGPVSGNERTPLPEGTLLAFRSDDEVKVRDYVGRPLVVNFWASWCAPCIEEMPALQRVADELEGQVVVLGVNAQDSPTSAQEFADDLGIAFELARDPDGSYFSSVGGFGWPTTLLVDEEGMIRYRHTGQLDAAKLRSLLETHLGVDAG